MESITELYKLFDTIIIDDTSATIMIQRIWRGYRIRCNRLPLVLQYIQKGLAEHPIKISYTSPDGRVNSCLDELTVIDALITICRERIQIPQHRMWYDILVRDYLYGWIPINIKTTTMNGADNAANLAMCVYAYTNAELDLQTGYNNGAMSKTLFDKLAQHEYNLQNGRDYYFIVVNKKDPTDIIINSVKGLTTLTSNINNLPFQIKWSKNKAYEHKPIKDCVQQFISCIKNTKPSWKDIFVANIKKM